MLNNVKGKSIIAIAVFTIKYSALMDTKYLLKMMAPLIEATLARIPINSAIMMVVTTELAFSVDSSLASLRLSSSNENEDAVPFIRL